jgi:hypothetical protein
MNPLEKLDHSELVLLLDILQDACRDRLERNLLNQAFEDRLSLRGAIAGRADPRPALRRWEPKYRKLLEVATELQTTLRGSNREAIAQAFNAVVARRPAGSVIPIDRRRVRRGAAS